MRLAVGARRKRGGPGGGGPGRVRGRGLGLCARARAVAGAAGFAAVAAAAGTGLRRRIARRRRGIGRDHDDLRRRPWAVDRERRVAVPRPPGGAAAWAGPGRRPEGPRRLLTPPDLPRPWPRAARGLGA